MNKRRIKFLITILFSACFFISCHDGKTKSKSESNLSDVISDDIPVYNFNELEPVLYKTNNKTVIVNFWAMWCAPCVKELPYLQAYANENPDIELLFVSMDFPKDIESKLKPFLKKKNITAPVILLDDPDANTWIDKVDPNWSGAIPFTIIFNDEKRLFYERIFENLDDLKNAIKKDFS